MGSKLGIVKIGKTKVRSCSPLYPANRTGKRAHLTGESLVQYIKDFDILNGLKSGSTYIIQGKRVTI